MQSQPHIEPNRRLESEYLDIEEKVNDDENLGQENEESAECATTLEVVNALKDAFKADPNLIFKLKFKALSYIKYYFRKNTIDLLTSEDVVNEVIRKIIDGDRKWYRKRTPNIVHLLMMATLSFVRNEWKKKKKIITGIKLYDESGNLIEDNIVDLQRAYLWEDMEHEFFREQLEDQIIKLYKVLENDVDAWFVLDELLKIDHSEVKKPETLIAKELRIPELDVKNAIRRIRRKINRLVS